MRKKMFGLMFLFGCLFGSTVVLGGPANPEIFMSQQPSGEEFLAQQQGDEYFNYTVMADDSRFVIEKDEDGYWYYQTTSTNEFNARSFNHTEKKALVGIDMPPETVLTEDEIINKKDKISAELKNARRLHAMPAIQEDRAVNGPHNLVVILVDFDDYKIKYSEQDWYKKIFDQNSKSLVNYYNVMTNGAIKIILAKENYGTSNNGIIKVKLNGNHPNTGKNTSEKNQIITKQALIEAGKYINFAQYDISNNGIITPNELHLMIIVAGQEASAQGATESSVWGHHWMISSADQPVINNVKLREYTQFGEKHQSRQSTIGIIAHEFGHDLGLPDLYNTEKIGKGLGYTSVMASGSWGLVSGEYGGGTPVGLDAYSKISLGMDYEEVNNTISKKEIRAQSSEKPTILKIKTPDPNQYFLIENRQPTSYDLAMVDTTAIYSGGIAIYRVDENFIKNWNVGQQLVTIMKADKGIRGHSKYDEEASIFNADPFYYKGTGIHKKTQQVSFSSKSNPSTKLLNGDYLKYDLEILDSPNNKMNIKISNRGY